MEYGESKEHKESKFKLSMSQGEGDDMSQNIKVANLFYVIVFIFFAIISFVLYSSGNKWLGKIIVTNKSGRAPIGVECVARTTAPLAIWYAVHSLIMIGNPNLTGSVQTLIHCRFLFLHVIVLLGIWIGFWFVPDAFTKFYMEFSIYVSAVYMLIQIFFLVDFFNQINDKLLEKENFCIPTVITIVLGVLTLAAYGGAFYVFCPKGCNTNLAILIVNLILSVILFVLAALIEHASILTASLICAYVVYLVVAGCMCQTTCNRISTGSQGIAFSVVASIFTLMWCGYSAFSSTSQFEACDCGDGCDCCGCSQGEGGGCCPEECCGQERSHDKSFSLAFFHFLFALASVYLTMIVTHWGKTDEASPWMTDRGTIARWVNYASSWVVIALYFWTLIAPLVCKDRDFS